MTSNRYLAHHVCRSLSVRQWVTSVSGQCKSNNLCNGNNGNKVQKFKNMCLIYIHWGSNTAKYYRCQDSATSVKKKMFSSLPPRVIRQDFFPLTLKKTQLSVSFYWSGSDFTEKIVSSTFLLADLSNSSIIMKSLSLVLHLNSKGWIFFFIFFLSLITWTVGSTCLLLFINDVSNKTILNLKSFLLPRVFVKMSSLYSYW